MQYVFLVNTHAGQGAQLSALRTAVEALPEKAACVIHETAAPREATSFVREYAAAHPGPIRFIACGGDGTINEVFEGAVGLPDVSVTCYPCGSGNDFVKCFGGKDAFLDVAALLHAPEQPLDLLKVNDRYCVNITNFGFDTHVAVTMNNVRRKKLIGGKNAYTTGVITALCKGMRNKCTVTADGEKLNDGVMLLCTVANGQYVGGAFRCAPRAVWNDGLMDVCLVKPISRLRFVKLLGPYTNGEHLDDPQFRDIIVYRRAKAVDVTAAPGFAYSLDGEIIYSEQFHIEIVPGALRFAVPAAKA